MNIQSAVPSWLQISWAIAGCLVAVGGGLWLLCFFGPYIVWSKRFMVATRKESVELASRTVAHLENVQRDLLPLVKDAREVIGALRELVDEVKAQDPKRIVGFIDKLSQNGAIEAVAENIKKIAERIHVVLEKESTHFASREEAVRQIAGPKQPDHSEGNPSL